MATELATAYLTLIPSLKGAQGQIESQLSGINLDGTGKKLGSSLSSGISESVSSTAKAVSAAGGFLSDTFGKAAKVGVGAVAAIGTGIAGLAAKGGLTRALNLEQAQTMFKGLKLDWEDYRQTVQDAVDGTAYTMDSAALVAAGLAASGVSAGDQMRKSLNACVGTAATFGTDLAGLGGIFQKVAAQGKLSGENLMQLSDRGINAISVLSQHLGKSREEVSKMVTEGKIDFQTFSDAMYEAFGDSAQAANETFTGSLANMRSALNKIGENFMTPFKDNAIPVFNAVREALNEVRGILAPTVDRFKELSASVSGKLVSSIQAFTGSLKEGKSLTEAIKSAIDTAFGEGTYQKIASVVMAVGTLATLGSFLKTMGAGMSVASKALEGLSSIGGKLSSAASSVSGFLSKIGPAAISSVTTFGKSLVHGLVPQNAFASIRGLGQDLSYGLRDCKKDLSDAFASIKESVSSKLGGIGELIDSKLGGIPSKVGSALSGMKSIVGESLGNAADAFRAKFNIGGHADKESGLLSAAFSKVKSAAGTLGGPLISATAGLTAVAGGLLVAGVAAAAAGVDVQSAADKLLDTISGLTANMPVVAQQFAEVLPGLVTQVTAAVPSLVAAFQQAMMSLVQVLPIVLPEIVNGLTTLVTQLVPVLVSLAPMILDAGLQLFTALLQSLTEILPVLIEQIPVLVEQVSTVLIANLPLLLEAGLTLFMALTQAFITMLPQLISMLPSLISRVVDTLISFSPQLLSAAGQLFMMMVKAVPQILSSLLAAVGELLSQLPGKVMSFAGKMAEAAKNMVLGMVNGIGDAAGWVVGKIQSLCSDALGAIKGFFGIASPSKLMRKIWRYVGQGSALGLSDTAQSVVDEMRAIAEDVADEAASIPSVPIAFSVVPPEPTAYSRTVELEERNDSASASAIDRMNQELTLQSESQVNALERVGDKLAYILGLIYEVIPEPESDWDFKRRVRRAANG